MSDLIACFIMSHVFRRRSKVDCAVGRVPVWVGRRYSKDIPGKYSHFFSLLSVLARRVLWSLCHMSVSDKVTHQAIIFSMAKSLRSDDSVVMCSNWL
jgi:hypothetical protein